VVKKSQVEAKLAMSSRSDSEELRSTAARYEKAGYAKLIVVLTCKSHGPGFGESDDRPSAIWKSKLAFAVVLLATRLAVNA
jgi:hypothetical protein